MRAACAIATLVGLSGFPVSAFAQAAATDSTALYAGPLYVVGTLLLLAIGASLSAPGWNRVGLLFWVVVVAAGAFLSMWALPGAAKGKPWQLPAMVITLLPFLFVAEQALRRLQRR